MKNELPRPIDPEEMKCSSYSITTHEDARARYFIKHAFERAVMEVGFSAARCILSDLLEKTKR